MERAKDFTKGNLWKQIICFSLPLMVSQLLQVLFNLSDIAVVGRFAGSGALGSVGSTSILVALFTGILIGVGCGVNVPVARFFAAKREKDLSETVHTAAILSVLIGVVVMGIGVGFARPILLLLKTKPDLIDGAVLYLRIYFLGMPALALYNFGSAVFSAIGDTRRPLYYLTIAGVGNIALNLVFVIVFRMAVAGVALATILTQYLSAILILLALARCRESYGLRRKALRVSRDKAALILRLGIPTAMQNAIFQIANLFIQTGVNSFDSLMVKGNSAAANADALVYDVMSAFYTACSSFIGQNLGVGNKKRIRKSYFICLLYAFLSGAVLGLSLVFFGEGFLSLFTKEPDVIAAGMTRLKIMGCSYAVSAFMDCAIAASRGLQHTLAPTIMVIGGSCVFRVIWVYTVFAYFGTILSLYSLYLVSWSITALAENLYFAYVYRKTQGRTECAECESTA